MPYHRLAPIVAVMLALALGNPSLEARAGTRVYLMRGLMDVSTGLDDLGEKLRRRGVAAVVDSYTSEAALAARAIKDFKAGSGRPVVIIGHSLGADAAVHMAERLQVAKVPVALIVAFSPATSLSIPRNVAKVVNYYQSNSAWNNTYRPGAGFSGSLRNINLAAESEIHHFNIEKVERLHKAAIGQIMALASTAAATPAPPEAPQPVPPKRTSP